MQKVYGFLILTVIGIVWGQHVFRTGSIPGVFAIACFVLAGAAFILYYEKNPKKEKILFYYICLYFTKRGERLRICEKPNGRILGQYATKEFDYLTIVNTMNKMSRQINIPVFREEDDFLDSIEEQERKKRQG